MIDAEDFVVADKGLMKAGEVEVGMRVLGLRSSKGSLTWSKIDEAIPRTGDALRVYGDQSEFALFEDTVVVVHGRGPTKIYKDVASSNIYHSDHKVETVSLSRTKLEDIWHAENGSYPTGEETN